MLTKIKERYRLWRRRSQVRRELNQLTDKDLNDLGITRFQFKEIVRTVK